MSAPVRRIGPGDLGDAVSTPGIIRHVADESGSHWMGRVESEPNTMSGWHHHGDHTTLGYIVSGTARLEFGPGGTEAVTVSAGDFFVVPPATIHREGNPTDQPGEAVIVRYGAGPPVFPADGPEPA
jgi:uncharacterized RmlC-like cupin family protein